ncbi:MAG: ABC transporter [Gammaproteobacteria bacterium RIFCSPHIGHO2_12_FULL_35_23]|nr:MAG: ABC transporter [Gammaproteobacteria bacterium RIFCSPHIGHO2_12_FULL_35_23]
MYSSALEVNHLTKIYKNGFTALNDVSLTIQQGDFFSLLGPNGAGKTTLIGVITTLIKKTSGTITIYGHDLAQEEFVAKQILGVVPQEINLPAFETCWQILINQAGYHGIPVKAAKESAEQCLRQLFLWDKRDSQTIALSGGMKRRLMIARALIHQPKLLILDEPTAGVDIEIRRSMWQFLSELNRNGTTILLTTHYLEEAENLCNKVALINLGKIQYQGEMKQFISQLEVETFVLQIAESLTGLPLPTTWNWRLVNSQTIEVDLPKEKTISELIEFLHSKNITVIRLTNKFNRLEELFINLTKQVAHV